MKKFCENRMCFQHVDVREDTTHRAIDVAIASGKTDLRFVATHEVTTEDGVKINLCSACREAYYRHIRPTNS